MKSSKNAEKGVKIVGIMSGHIFTIHSLEEGWLPLRPRGPVI